MRSTCTEISAFIVVVRYTYCNKRLLEFSGLVRAITTQATIYFLAIIAIQIYLQAAPSSGIVGLSFIPHVVPQSSFKLLHSERIFLVVAPRECTLNLKCCNRDRSTDVSPHYKEHILLVSRFIQGHSHKRMRLLAVHVSQLQPCLDSTICGCAQKVCGSRGRRKAAIKTFLQYGVCQWSSS